MAFHKWFLEHLENQMLGNICCISNNNIIYEKDKLMK